MPEIPAAHHPIAQDVIYRTLVLPAVQREFHRVRVRLGGPVPHPSEAPLIVYLTHTAWWDAYMLFVLNYLVLGGGVQNYIMMEAQQLRAYRFFAWCGAFSIDRHVPGDSERSIAYVANRLRERPARALWMFPQGLIVPPDRRPLVLYPGMASVVQQCGGASLWPVALRYQFRGEQQPEALIHCGVPHYASGALSKKAILAETRARLTTAADQLRADTDNEDFSEYRILLRGREGINRWFDELRMRIRRGPA